MKLGIISLLFILSTHANAALEFCLTGDTGTGYQEQYEVADAMLAAGCGDIFIAGDIIYEHGARSENDQQWIEKFEKPYSKLINNGAHFFFALGNHDYRADLFGDVEQIYSRYADKTPAVTFPSRYYALSMDGVCAWIIDSQEFDGKQASELEQSMANSPECLWRLVFGHHPIVSSGLHGNGSSSFVKKLHPILDKYADVYFSGHDHNLADEGWVTTGGRGYRQIVSGAGGKLRDVGNCRDTGCEFAASILGFVKVSVAPDLLTMKFIDSKTNVIYELDLPNRNKITIPYAAR